MDASLTSNYTHNRSSVVVVERTLSWFDRILNAALVVALLVASAVGVALYVQRHNQPTVIYYCDSAACSNPAGESTSRT